MTFNFGRLVTQWSLYNQLTGKSKIENTYAWDACSVKNRKKEKFVISWMWVRERGLLENARGPKLNSYMCCYIYN